MRGNGFRRLHFALFAGTCGGAMVLTAGSAFGDDTAVIMGGSGMPIPLPPYIHALNDLYLHCGPPTCSTDALATPEALYPLIGGPKELTFDQSVAQGASILNNEIQGQLAEGNDVTVLGYSQSATVATFAMRDIATGSAGRTPDPDQLSFVLLGDPSNPNGGVLERADIPAGADPNIPSLGITFSGATPVTEYPTEIYTGEYDGFSDFPRYPLNLLADLNALVGIVFVHGEYPDVDLSSAVEVPTSAGYDGATTYYMIPTENLPLLDLLRSIPVVGPVLSDLIQPDLKVLVNLGYGDPNYGWVNEDANVPTPAGVFPSLADLEKVPALLVSGTQQGIQNAISDLENPAQLFSLANNPLLNLLETTLPSAALLSEDFSIPPPSDTLQGIVNAFSEAASNLYGTLLPTADIVNALFTTLPAENVSLFTYELGQGDLVDAIGLPLIADVTMIPLAGLVEIAAVGEGTLIAALDIVSPFVDVSSLF